MDGKAETPGMDEIRATISRIIADGEEGRASHAPAAAALGGPRAVYTLRSPVPDGAAPDRLPPFGAEPRHATAGDADAPSEPASEEEPLAWLAPSSPDADRLLSPAAEAAAGAAFGRLSTGAAGQSRTLEAVVAEMLRPMLKAWLDENLPAMVERLVQEEIERVSRTRR